MPPMTATVTQIPAEDHDDDGRHRDQRDRAQQHRDRHEGVLGTLAQLEQRGSEDRGDQTRDEPDESVTQRDHEIAHDELAVRRRGRDREEVVPDVDRTLGDQRRDLEDPEHTHPDGQGGDESQDEGQQAPAEGAQDVPGCRAADIATEVCGRRCGRPEARWRRSGWSSLSLRPGCDRAGDESQQHEAEQRHGAAGKGESPDERGVGVLLGEDHGDADAGSRSFRRTRRARRRGTPPAPRSAARSRSPEARRSGAP